MPKDPYYCFFTGDYSGDTQGLSLTEHGAYRLLLDVYYSQEFLADDMAEVYRICRAFEPFERAAADKVISRYFMRSDGRLLNKRAERELAFRRKQAENSAKGGEATRKKWQKQREIDSPKEGPNPGPKEGPNHSSPSPSPSPYKEKENKGDSDRQKKKAQAKEPFALPEWFPPETWRMFLAHRREVKAAITEGAYPSFVAKFFKLKAKGWSPSVVVDTLVERGWRWFKPEWLKDEPQPAKKMVCKVCGKEKSNILSDGICWTCKEKR